MDKIWFKNYPKGVAHEIDADQPGTVPDVFNESATKYSDKPAYTSIKTTITFGQAKRLMDQFSSFLQNKLHLKKGDCLAIMMPNVMQYPVVMFGALQAGLIVTNVNPLYTSSEVKKQLEDSEASVLVILENFAATYAKIANEVRIKHVIVAKIGDLLHGLWGPILNFSLKYIAKTIPSYHLEHVIPFKKTLRKGSEQPFKKVEIDRSDIAILQYTGGTTGTPKAAMLTHRNICANMQQALEWVSPILDEGKECIVTPLPLYHIFSLTVNLMIVCKLGCHNILIANPRDTKRFIGQMRTKKYKITVITCVNTLFKSLVHHPDFTKIDFSHWKLALGGGAAIQSNVAEKWNQLTGIPIVEAYGLTETSPGVCVNPVTIEKYTGFVGLPLPSTDIKVMSEDENELPLGQEGELWVKGPQVMKGYWRNPEETEKVLHDGWFATGDIAVVNEEGYVKLVDRKKDMVIISGFNVYPNEVEDVLSFHPDIVECAVIGVESEQTGEALKAFIVSKNPNLSKQDVIKFARKNLTGYKIPKLIEFRKELPKSNVGKILRRVLKEEENHKKS
ncbi:MAG: long-chain-fatty-acid--CoA ligase [Francisella sp.]|nr:MAG: long-chain-fatty-acid--CoA ligase [Francisella sp.]